MPTNPYLPHVAHIVERRQDAPTIFTLRLAFEDAAMQRQYRFLPGQFNMLYLYGVGEVAISIVSDPEEETMFDHTIRVVHHPIGSHGIPIARLDRSPAHWTPSSATSHLLA